MINGYDRISVVLLQEVMGSSLEDVNPVSLHTTYKVDRICYDALKSLPGQNANHAVSSLDISHCIRRQACLGM